MIVMMTYFLIFSLVVYIVLFLFFKKIKPVKRLLISVAVFFALSISFTTLLIVGGDRPLPGSIAIDMDDIDPETGAFYPDKEEKYLPK